MNTVMKDRYFVSFIISITYTACCLQSKKFHVNIISVDRSNVQQLGKTQELEAKQPIVRNQGSKEKSIISEKVNVFGAAIAKAKLAIVKSDKEKKLERESRILNKMERKLATYQLSCTSVGKGFRKRSRSEKALISKSSFMKSQQSTTSKMEEDEQKHALAEHLRSIAPFNRRWQVTETINEGTYGVVFAVRDVETGVQGVIKVAKSVGNDAGNQTAEWEGFVLEKMYKLNPNASVVRLLDKGMLADQNGEGMEFMVLEKAQFAIMDWLNNYTGLERKLAVTRAMLQMLKGIYDMHREGLLHRDLKPDNMGILSTEQPFVVLFDLGMTRMYTDQDGLCRTPRTTCPFRGTPEWASGWASKSREQSRYDDLIAWLYVACELYDPATTITQPLPWTYRQSNRIVGYLKTIYCPAHILLRRSPRQFYEINSYLMTVNRNATPRYKFLADKVMEAIKELEVIVEKEKAGNAGDQAIKAEGMDKTEKVDEGLEKGTRRKIAKPQSAVPKNDQNGEGIKNKLDEAAKKKPAKDSEKQLTRPATKSLRKETRKQSQEKPLGKNTKIIQTLGKKNDASHNVDANQTKVQEKGKKDENVKEKKK